MTGPNARDQPEPTGPEPGTAAYAGMVLHSARIAQSPPWSQRRLMEEMQLVAARYNKRIPGLRSLQTRITRWEQGYEAPGGFYRELLAEALGITVSDFALPADRNAFTPLHFQPRTARLPDPPQGATGHDESRQGPTGDDKWRRLPPAA